MTTQQFEEWSKGTTIIDRKLDLHASYGLTTWSWLIEKNGKVYSTIQWYDPTKINHEQMSFDDPELLFNYQHQLEFNF